MKIQAFHKPISKAGISDIFPPSFTFCPEVSISSNVFGVCEVAERSEPHTLCYPTEPKERARERSECRVKSQIPYPPIFNSFFNIDKSVGSIYLS